MRRCFLVLGALLCSTLVAAQTADEIIAKNIQAKGGLQKIKAIQSVRTTGRLEGAMKAVLSSENKRPNLLRDTFTFQGMTGVTAFDGTTGWQISPFGGKKDPQLLSEDEMRDLVEEADFDGPLVDYKAKGNEVQYLGKDMIDGDDAYRLKVTLRNGDILNYYFDPETYLEFRTEKQQFIRGAMRETVTEYGSYKPVNGVLYAFAIESGSKRNPQSRQKVTIEKIEVNVPINDADFKMPMPPNSQPNPQPAEKKSE